MKILLFLFQSLTKTTWISWKIWWPFSTFFFIISTFHHQAFKVAQRLKKNAIQVAADFYAIDSTEKNKVYIFCKKCILTSTVWIRAREAVHKNYRQIPCPLRKCKILLWEIKTEICIKNQYLYLKKKDLHFVQMSVKLSPRWGGGLNALANMSDKMKFCL